MEWAQYVLRAYYVLSILLVYMQAWLIFITYEVGIILILG